MSVEKNLKSRNRMKSFIVMAMLLGSSVASAENKQITSPDGKLVVTVSDWTEDLLILLVMTMFSFCNHLHWGWLQI